MTATELDEVQQQPTEIPRIDLSLDDDKISEELRGALTTIGFATLVNHGLEELIPKAFAASKAFFSLPLSEKMKVEYQGHDSNRGYIACGKETYESSKFGGDIKETYDINPIDSKGYSQPWPTALSCDNNDDNEALQNFQKDLCDYFDSMDGLHLRLMKLIAIGLGIPTDFLLSQVNEQHENLRLLHYPETPMPTELLMMDEREPVVRGNIHTDFGTITLLTQDKVGGLRVQRLDGEWIFVPPVENAVVVNVGDMFQRWSNDILKANPHQVVDPHSFRNFDDGDDEKEEKQQQPQQTIIPERYSIAFFCNANKETMLECFEQCVSEDRPARYEPVKAFDYITMRLSQTISSK